MCIFYFLLKSEASRVSHRVSPRVFSWDVPAFGCVFHRGLVRGAAAYQQIPAAKQVTRCKVGREEKMAGQAQGGPGQVHRMETKRSVLVQACCLLRTWNGAQHRSVLAAIHETTSTCKVFIKHDNIVLLSVTLLFVDTRPQKRMRTHNAVSISSSMWGGAPSSSLQLQRDPDTGSARLEVRQVVKEGLQIMVGSLKFRWQICPLFQNDLCSPNSHISCASSPHVRDHNFFIKTDIEVLESSE